MIQARKKTKARNKTVIELRKLIGVPQHRFAALVGVSGDTVVSWENGRNRVKLAAARVISFATGCDQKSLVRGGGKPSFIGGGPYTAQSYQVWRSEVWDTTDIKKVAGMMFSALLVAAKTRRINPLVISTEFGEWASMTAKAHGVGAEYGKAWRHEVGRC